MFTLINEMAKNFEKPKGLLGKITGLIMYFENRKINKWTIDQLKIQKNDRILEIGYGPGYAVQFILENYKPLRVDGIDVSEKMKETASKRNKNWMDSGSLRLFCGDVSQFETLSNTYDKIFSVNNYPLWEEQMKSLKQLFHFLKPGGKIILTVQPREEDATDQTARLLGESMKQDLQKAGFSNIEISFKKVRPILTVCVSGEK